MILVAQEIKSSDASLAKIETDPADPVYIRTVWGVGYKFEFDSVEA